MTQNLTAQKSNPKMADIVIIVVEDDAGMNKLVRRVLSRAGYAAEGATSGAEGLDKIAQTGNPIVILDYGLPDMNGAEFMAAVEKMGFRVPFLVLTGQGDERIAVEMMKLGAIDYVIKTFPFRFPCIRTDTVCRSQSNFQKSAELGLSKRPRPWHHSNFR